MTHQSKPTPRAIEIAGLIWKKKNTSVFTIARIIDEECGSDIAMAQLRIAYLESVLFRIQTHSGFDNNNCAMKPYDVLCECQRWAEEARLTTATE